MQWILAVGAIVCFAVASGGTITCNETSPGYLICGDLDDSTTVTNHSPHEVILMIQGATGIAANAFEGLNVRTMAIKPSLHNELRGVPVTFKADSFYSLRNITTLKIEHMKLNYAGDPLATLKKLERLYLYSNKFNEVPTEFLAPATELQTLRIVGDPISVIRTNAFAALKKLQYLELTYNKIKELEPGCFNGLDALTYLDLRYSPLTSLDGSLSARTLQGMPNLEILLATIQNNGTLEPGMFGGNPKLKEVELFGSMIKLIPSNVFNNLSLVKLTFTHGSIESIESGAFAGLNVKDMRFYLVDIGRSIKAYTFSDINVTGELRIYSEDMDLNQIEPRAFSGLRANRVTLTHNDVKVLATETFSGMHAKYLRLTAVPIVDAASDAFEDAYFETLYVYENSTFLAHRDEWGIPKNVSIVTICNEC